MLSIADKIGLDMMMEAMQAGNGGLVSASALSLLHLTPVIEANGPIYNGPGAVKPIQPFSLRPLELHQHECVNRAKKYATEQSIRAVLMRQTQAQQSQQVSLLKRNQSVSLLNRIYIGSIAYDVNEQHLRTALQQFGIIKSITMSRDPTTFKHKGFAFMEFEYPEAAVLAIDQLNGVPFSGRNLKVGRPSNLTNADETIDDLIAQHELTNRIYISGIHLELTEDEIVLVFEAFGKIVFRQLVRDPNSPDDKHLGFGYVEYDSLQSAKDAVTSMNQFNLGGQLLRVTRAIAPPEGYPATMVGVTTTSSAAAAAAATSTMLLPGQLLPVGGLPPAAAVAAASATAKVMTMEAEELASSSYNTVSNSSSSSYQNGGIQSASRIPPPDPPATSSSWHQHDSLADRRPVDPQKDLVMVVDHNHHGTPTVTTTTTTATRSVYNPSPSNQNDDASALSCLRLLNMVDVGECDAELETEVRDECQQYGPVQKVVIRIDDQMVGVFVLFRHPQAAQLGKQALNGRFFAGRQISADLYDLRAFLANQLSLS